MTMTTAEGVLAAHMAADLSVMFARRHAAQGRHDIADHHYQEAVQLYVECGCSVLAVVALECARAEGRLARLYRVDL